MGRRRWWARRAHPRRSPPRPFAVGARHRALPLSYAEIYIQTLPTLWKARQQRPTAASTPLQVPLPPFQEPSASESLPPTIPRIRPRTSTGVRQPRRITAPTLGFQGFRNPSRPPCTDHTTLPEPKGWFPSRLLRRILTHNANHYRTCPAPPSPSPLPESRSIAGRAYLITTPIVFLTKL